jgi:hypothetical protein
MRRWTFGAKHSVEKLHLELDFGWRSGFTAAISGLFSVLASAAEGDYGAHQEFFSKLFSRRERLRPGTKSSQQTKMHSELAFNSEGFATGRSERSIFPADSPLL